MWLAPQNPETWGWSRGGLNLAKGTARVISIRPTPPWNRRNSAGVAIGNPVTH